MNRSDPLDPSVPTTEIAADALDQATPQSGDAVRQFVTKAGAMTQRGVEQWRGQAEAWRDGTSEHIRAHPMRSVVIATGAGMLLALLVRALNR